MTFLIKAGQLIISLSILVILHEFGHFLFAKLFKTRVEKFYLFFNPWFSLFKFKKGETEYGIGWLPLGGYVKISGMIDESMDKEQLKQPPQPYEFRSKPSWQRLLIMIGGVLFNFITAIIIFILLIFFNGKNYIPNENLKYGVVWDSLALEHGLVNGDKIVAVDNKKIEDFADFSKEIIEGEAQKITVERDNKIVDVQLPADFVQQILANNAVPLAYPLITTVVDSIIPGSSADEKGIIKGDRIIEINNEPVTFFSDIASKVTIYKDNGVTLRLVRNSDTLFFDLGKLKKGLIGIGPETPEVKKIEYNFGESIPAGINYGISTLSSYVKSLKHVFTREGVKQIGGFGAIGNLFPEKWEWDVFWNLTAFLSIILAFMNILPIPALDGGHVSFLVFEMITGRKPSDKFLEYAQVVGMLILFSLLIYANGNDIYKWINGLLNK